MTEWMSSFLFADASFIRCVDENGDSDLRLGAVWIVSVLGCSFRDRLPKDSQREASCQREH